MINMVNVNFTIEFFHYNNFYFSNSTRTGGENCWYKIAWAFLKPCGNSGKRHIDKQVRLQLYRPKRVAKKIPRNKCEVNYNKL